MFAQPRLWEKLSDAFNLSQTPDRAEFSSQPEQLARARLKAQGEWFGAIAALEHLLFPLAQPSAGDRPPCHGLLLCGPIPILSHTDLISQFQAAIFRPDSFPKFPLLPFQLPKDRGSPPTLLPHSLTEFSLLPEDPIAREQFCLAFTPHFGLLMVLGEDPAGMPGFQFSFDPEVVQQGWLALRSRLLLTHPHQLSPLDQLAARFPPPAPDYRLVMEFSRQLLKHLPDLPASETVKPRSGPCGSDRGGKRTEAPGKAVPPEVELLQALTHEIRTPLTTIRTMTRLLLKRGKLTAPMLKCLEVIDRECTEQIDRMELIFRAAELKTAPEAGKPVHLVPISLEEVFQQSIPRWQEQAERRHVLLEVALPKKLPQVVSDPALLDRVLTGLMENFTRSLPRGGQICVQVRTAGHQLKLQFHTPPACPANPLKALGQLLMFQPETGSLSLNLEVTKNLFEAIGGKLVVRQRPQQGEVLTIFLPLGKAHPSPSQG